MTQNWCANIVIENLTLENKEETRFTETDLNQHITSKVKTQTEVIDFDFPQLAKNDFELYQAIKILKVTMMTIQ